MDKIRELKNLAYLTIASTAILSVIYFAGLLQQREAGIALGFIFSFAGVHCYNIVMS